MPDAMALMDEVEGKAPAAPKASSAMDLMDEVDETPAAGGGNTRQPAASAHDLLDEVGAPAAPSIGAPPLPETRAAGSDAPAVPTPPSVGHPASESMKRALHWRPGGGGGAANFQAAQAALDRPDVNPVVGTVNDIGKTVAHGIADPLAKAEQTKTPLGYLRGITGAAIGAAGATIAPSMTLREQVAADDRAANRGEKRQFGAFGQGAEMLASGATLLPLFDLYGEKVIKKLDAIGEEERRLKRLHLPPSFPGAEAIGEGTTLLAEAAPAFLAHEAVKAGGAAMNEVGAMRGVKPDLAAPELAKPAPIVRAPERPVVEPSLAPDVTAPTQGGNVAGQLAAMGKPVGLDARLAKAGLTLESAFDAALRQRPGELDMLRPADRAFIDGLVKERARAASFPKKPEMMQAVKEKVAPPEPKIGGLAPVPKRAELLPPPGEGTVPTVGEKAIESAGGAEKVAKDTGRVVVPQADGAKLIVPPERAAEAQAKAAEGKAAEVVNGEGTSPKPAKPTEMVTARDEAGNEVRTVLTDTPEKTAAAVAANPGAEVKAATPENVAGVLKGRETPSWLKENAASTAKTLGSDMLRKIEDLAIQGKTAKEMAAELGIDVQQVGEARNHLGIPSRAAPGYMSSGVAGTSPEFAAWRDKTLAARNDPTPATLTDAHSRTPASVGEQEATPARPGYLRGRPMSSEAGAVPNPLAKPAPDRYAGMTPQGRAAAQALDERIVYEEPKPTVAEKAKGVVLGVRKFARKEAPVADFERGVTGEEAPAGPTAQAKYAQGASGGKTRALMETGSLETRKATPVSIEDAISEIGAGNDQHLSRYLLAKRALSRYAPEGLDFGISPEQAASVVRDVEAAHPKVAAAARTISDTFKHVRARLVEAGVVTPEQSAAMDKANPGGFYVPVERVVGGSESAGTMRGAINRAGKVFKRVTGGTQPIHDPLPRVFESLRKSVRAIDEGEFVKRLVETHDKNPAAAETWMREIKPDAQHKVADTLKSRMDFDEFSAEWKKSHHGSTIDSAEAILDEYLKKSDEGVVPVTVNGKTRWFEFLDRDLYDVVKGLDVDPIAKSKILRVLAPFSSVQRLGTTVLSGAFNLSQFLRDPRHAFVMTKTPSLVPLRYALADMPRSYFQELKSGLAGTRLGKKLGVGESPATRTYEQLGSETMMGLDRKAQARRIGDLTKPGFIRENARPATIIDNARAAAGLIESGPRQAEMTGVLRRRGAKPGAADIPRDTLVEASNAASNVTAPFKLGSDAAKAGGAYKSFFNARLQANWSVLQMMKERPGVFAARVAAVSVLPRLFLWAKNHDEDWYKRLPDWQKYGAWNPTSGVKIPNINVLDMPAVTMEFILNKLVDNDPVAAGKLAAQWLDELSPVGDVLSSKPKLQGLLPTAAQGAFEVASGKDAFTGREINPRSMEGGERVMPEEVGREYDSDVARVASKYAHRILGTNVTRAEIDHLIASYLGTVGRETTRLGTQIGGKEAADLPVVGRLFPRIKASRYVDDYYDLRTTYEGQTNMARALKHKDKETARRLAIPGFVAADVARIDAALRDAGDRYRNAPSNVRPAIAAHMDNLAKKGLRLLGHAGTGRVKPERQAVPDPTVPADEASKPRGYLQGAGK